MLSIYFIYFYNESSYAECHYADCCYADYRGITYSVSLVFMFGIKKLKCYN
jgi:hypothetical protein